MIAILALVSLVQTVVAAGLLYHYVLLLASAWPRRARPALHADPALRFAVALPAHNEEQVIGGTVAGILEMHYPRERFDVHVAADHCDDGTAQAARAAGAIVHERKEGLRGRKGYALEWLFARLLGDPRRYDAIVVFDADSYVSPEFLEAMNRMLAGGAQVVQGRHVIANPDSSAFSALADADMRLNNRIRNQAKANLGLSARLMGDGMCFQRRVLERYPWAQASSLIEDREYGIYLAIHGLHVQFAPEAISTGQATARWDDGATQRLRWYGGVFELQRRYLGPLLVAAWRDRNPAALDHALELLLPPFSMLAMVGGGLVILTAPLVLLRALPPPSLAISIAAAALALAYPFLGLLLDRAPRRVFRALLAGPFYVVWRVWISLRVQVRRGNVPWVRTRRTEETRPAR